MPGDEYPVDNDNSQYHANVRVSAAAMLYSICVPMLVFHDIFAAGENTVMFVYVTHVVLY